MNKVLILIAGILVGYYIAKNRMKNQLLTQADQVANDVTTAISGAVDKALAAAETNGMSVSDVRSTLNGTASPAAGLPAGTIIN